MLCNGQAAHQCHCSPHASTASSGELPNLAAQPARGAQTLLACLAARSQSAPFTAARLCREPATNLADNLLRDYEQRWWGAVKKVRLPGPQLCTLSLAERLLGAASVAFWVAVGCFASRCWLCCCPEPVGRRSGDIWKRCLLLQGDEEMVNTMMEGGADVLARTGAHCRHAAAAGGLQ